MRQIHPTTRDTAAVLGLAVFVAVHIDPDVLPASLLDIAAWLVLAKVPERAAAAEARP